MNIINSQIEEDGEYKSFVKDMLRPLGFTTISQMHDSQKKIFQKKVKKEWDDMLKMHPNMYL